MLFEIIDEGKINNTEEFILAEEALDMPLTPNQYAFAENYVKEMNTLNIDVDYELDIPSLRDVEDLVPPKRVAYFGDYNRCCEFYWAKNSGKLLRRGHVGSCVTGKGYPSRYDSTKVLAVRPAIWLTMNTYWGITAR